MSLDTFFVLCDLRRAGLSSLNELTVHAVAMETWRAFHSQDGPDGSRNALGQILFPSNVATRSTRSEAAGVVSPHLPYAANTLVDNGIAMWNKFPALREASTKRMASNIQLITLVKMRLQAEIFASVIALVLLMNVCIGQEGPSEIPNVTSNSREGKLFPIFQIVQFPNTACQGASSRNGTCYTLSLACGSTSSENCTYLTQTSTTANTISPCTYTICPCDSNVCRIRFDFDSFQIAEQTVGTAVLVGVPAVQNNATHLQDQCYSMCWRVEEGQCGICFTPVIEGTPGMVAPSTVKMDSSENKRTTPGLDLQIRRNFRLLSSLTAFIFSVWLPTDLKIHRGRLRNRRIPNQPPDPPSRGPLGRIRKTPR
eukprot:maker-scaffold124_size330879-snap-gene-2.10 protein:Tk01496 transcript:maker-scaffold124_size330879-snap-gene-2.10-mRNA-1 annotation:"AGAP009769-PA"